MTANRPHFHAWFLASTGRIWYWNKRGFFTRQAARQWAARRRPKGQHMVLQCHNPACAPMLER